jgi:hypothetical protein
MNIQLGPLWESASVVLALQATSIGWRINRESQLAEKGEPTWMPAADLVNLCAMAISAGGVFVAPVLDLASPQTASRVFGLVLILMVGHAFALAAHYELFKSGHRSHAYFPVQERVVVAAIVLVGAVYIAAAWIL